MGPPKLVLTLIATALSLAPLGRAYAQKSKICDELRANLVLSTLDPSLSQDLRQGQKHVLEETLRRRELVFYYLRRAQLNRDAEQQLNLLEPLLSGQDPRATAALKRIREGLQAEAKQSEEQARFYARQAYLAFRELCGYDPDPSTITLPPLPGLIPAIGVVTAPPSPPARLSACGTWRWNSGPGWTTAVLSRNGKASNAAGGPCNGHATGTWSESGTTVTVIWTWLCPGGNSKSRDELALSADGNTLTMPGDSGWAPAQRTGACR